MLSVWQSQSIDLLVVPIAVVLLSFLGVDLMQQHTTFHIYHMLPHAIVSVWIPEEDEGLLFVGSCSKVSNSDLAWQVTGRLSSIIGTNDPSSFSKCQ